MGPQNAPPPVAERAATADASVATAAPTVSAAAPVAPRLLALFAAGLLLLNFPLLALWDHPLRVAGWPLFPSALFLIWAGLIGVLAWWMERLPDEAGGEGLPGGPSGPADGKGL